MSLNDTERETVVRLQLQKAHSNFLQIELLQKLVIEITLLIVCIIPCFMLYLLCSLMMVIAWVRIVVL